MKTMQKIKALGASILLLFSFSLRAQIGKNFAQETKALIEAEASELMRNETNGGDGYNSYRTALKLEGFEISYIVSSVIGNVLSARYLLKGDDETMDAIYDRLNTIPYLVFDSKDRAGLLKKSDSTLMRKIVLKSRETGKNVLTATLSKTGSIDFVWSR